jgi:hypothetical protein
MRPALLLQLAVASLIAAAAAGPVTLALFTVGAALAVPPSGIGELLSALPLLILLSGFAAMVAAPVAALPSFVAGGLLWMARGRAWARRGLTWFAGGALVGFATLPVTGWWHPNLLAWLRDPDLAGPAPAPLLLALAGGLSALLFRSVMTGTAPFFGTEEDEA